MAMEGEGDTSEIRGSNEWRTDGEADKHWQGAHAKQPAAVTGMNLAIAVAMRRHSFIRVRVHRPTGMGVGLGSMIMHGNDLVQVGKTMQQVGAMTKGQRDMRAQGTKRVEHDRDLGCAEAKSLRKNGQHANATGTQRAAECQPIQPG